MSAPQPWSVLAPVRELIAERRKALDELEAGLDACERAFGVKATGAAAAENSSPVPSTKRSAVATGSLADRILGLVRPGPVGMDVLLAGAKAPTSAVRREVGRLVDAKRLARTGKSRGTRYALPKP